MIRFALLLMVGGGFLIFFGCQEYRLSSASDAEPTEITAAELITNGVGENAHVMVTDLFMLNNYVYQDTGDASKVSKAWMPAVSFTDPYALDYVAVLEEEGVGPDDVVGERVATRLLALPVPSNFGIIVISDELKTLGQIDTFLNESQVQGLIINEIDSLGSEELAKLRETYPGMDADKVLILEHNRKPAGAGKTLAMIGGGVVLFLLGPGLFFMTRGS